MKTNVLCDIDGVICDFYKGFGEFLNKKYEAKLNLNKEPTSYTFKDWASGVKSINYDKSSYEWIMNGGMLTAPIYDGARDFILDLANIADIYIVTARIGDFRKLFPEEAIKKIEIDTLQWFKYHNIPVDNVYFEHNKIDFCKKNNIPILIEDKLSTAIDGGLNKIKSILLDRGWNKDTLSNHLYDRAFSYNDIIQKIKG